MNVPYASGETRRASGLAVALSRLSRLACRRALIQPQRTPHDHVLIASPIYSHVARTEYVLSHRQYGSHQAYHDPGLQDIQEPGQDRVVLAQDQCHCRSQWCGQDQFLLGRTLRAGR